MTARPPTLVSDALVDFLLYEVLDATSLTRLPAFADHGRDTFDPWLATCRRLGQDLLFPAYKAMDAEPPRLEVGEVRVHPRMHLLWRELVKAGVIASARPFEVGGQQLPLTVATFASAYLMAGNLSAYAFAGLTAGAAHLIEAFGDADLKERFMRPMYSGEITGTMALTEPQAGSSLADVQTRATPTVGGHYLVRGSKMFISAGDHDLTENIVHLVLARIEGAPPGTRGISLFAVPRLRTSDRGTPVKNDVHVSGMVHKMGWRGVPSLALSFGDAGDCHGWLVGPRHQGLRCMFQMMNEARIMVGLNAAATASVAYHESVRYSLERRQGRPLGVDDPIRPPVEIAAHPDVRRMLLRQKAIVEGALCLLGVTARYADLAEHSSDAVTRERSRLLLDLLTPIAKTFPAERGFESNALALQIHGGYGYSSELLAEAWLRDQKLNSIHEGTSGVQALDLLGRKVLGGGGAALVALREEVLADLGEAEGAGLPSARVARVHEALEQILALTRTLAERGAGGDAEGMLAHATDYLEAFSIVIIAWMWTKMATRAAPRGDDLAHGIEHAARYWSAAELPRVPALVALCQSGDRSYLDLRPEGL